MQLTWKNATDNQTLTWWYVYDQGHSFVGKPISPGNSHVEPVPDRRAVLAMGFFGTYTGYQIVSFPESNAGAYAFAGDGQPTVADLEAMMSSMALPEAGFARKRNDWIRNLANRLSALLSPQRR
jgi:hypothetical protein